MRWPGRFLPLCALFSALFAALPFAHALPLETAVPGGLALVRLGNGAARPQAWFREKRVAVVRDGQGWVALVGLPLSLEPGVHPLRVASAGGSEETRPIRVASKRYPLQRFTVPDHRKVEPLPEDLLRIEREQKRIDEIKALFRETPDVDLAFRQPAAGRLTGIITDGDLRRHMEGLLSHTAAEVMTRNPRSIGPDQLGEKAVALMNDRKITCLFVVEPDGDGRPLGILHIHDCLRAGVV